MVFGDSGVAVDAHEVHIKETSKPVKMFFILIDAYVMRGTAQRFALPALGRGRRSRPT